MVSDHFDDNLLRRIEDAGLNASAPPQQRWVDGWLLRFSPGKAKRARCVNAVAPGRRAIDEKLAECAAVLAAAGLPLIVRITPFSQPPDLDDQLARSGLARIDDTRVMVRPTLADLPMAAVPAGIDEAVVDAAAYAGAVGALRGSPAGQIEAHAQRLALSPVPYAGVVWRRAGAVVACGQFAREGSLVGLYDVFTAPAARGAGLATALCTRLLSRARAEGASAAYLQVDAENAPARAVYHRLGFADGYAYHYRCTDPAAA